MNYLLMVIDSRAYINKNKIIRYFIILKNKLPPSFSNNHKLYFIGSFKIFHMEMD